MKTFIALSLSLLTVSCQDAPKEEVIVTEETKKVSVESRHPEWVKNANIYEVNIRQYTPEGTLNAFEQHLPRLKELGVDILWFMPIQPIGELNRKVVGEENNGSYYSISDYTAVHSDYGSVEDFKRVVEKAHSMGMKVILDWVANHTAFDHHWVKEHPEFFTAGPNGNSPIVALDNDGGATDWTDVADLNYANPDLHDAMYEEMAWWIKECDIDGFRCDVAGFVPIDFWNTTRPRLEEIKPVFMLAEWEDPAHMEAFNMNYGWEFHHILNELAKGKKASTEVVEYLKKNDSLYSDDDIRMYFTTNHDENAWNGTVFERMGEQHLNMFVIAATLPGMPLIYSGQEAGLDHRLSFFGKDEIDWSNEEYKNFYSRMLKIKHENEALWNAKWGGDLELIDMGEENVLAYRRIKGNNEVVVFVNLSSEESYDLDVSGEEFQGDFEIVLENLPSDWEISMPLQSGLKLGPSTHAIYIRK
jgi:glycosidase